MKQLNESDLLRIKERNRIDRCQWWLHEGKLRKAEKHIVDVWQRYRRLEREISVIETAMDELNVDSTISGRDIERLATELMMKVKTVYAVKIWLTYYRCWKKGNMNVLYACCPCLTRTTKNGMHCSSACQAVAISP